MPPHQPSPTSATDEVTVGILAALPVEGAAMAKLIDDPRRFEVDSDPNFYWVGSMPSKNPNQPHRVALAVLPRDGTRYAAMMCTNLLRTFTQVRCVVMMGIAGGIPRQVRLGDIVVATSGILDYGLVRHVDGARQLRRVHGQISSWLLRAARELQFKESFGDRPWERWLDPELAAAAPDYRRPTEETERPFVSGLKVHYGSIASADVLMRDEAGRDGLAAEFDDLLAVEMEGSGIAASAVAHDVPWFMVRGIADYCEAGGKNDIWHHHASYATAAYLRALLEECRPHGRPLPLVHPGENDRLVALMDRLPSLDLRVVCEAACPHLPEIPPGVLAGADRTFHYLSMLNADSDGMPPALAFVDELARLAEGALAAELHRWVDERAQLMRVEKPLEQRRFRAMQTHPVDYAKPSLLIEISLDGIDHGSFRVNSWIQERAGPWRPRPGPGEAKNLSLPEVQAFVGGLVDQAEHHWITPSEPVTIEFLLPTGLLNLPVEWWRSGSTGQELPLCRDHQVVVRSLDRMVSGDRARVWGRRWSALSAEPLRTKVHWGEQPSTEDELAAWGVRMRADEDVGVVVLSGPPEQSPAREELRMALRAGIPVILWNRQEFSPREAETIRDLVGEDPSTLPARIRDLRARAAETLETGRPRHPGRVVVLLWDDPDRVVEAGRLL